ncbi:MAG: tryptophan--tRNA ligase [Patescibacteria group bacterium]
MKRILSGVQPSGKPHIGNYLGAMRQHIEMQKNYECFLFIADLHALTTVREPQTLRELSIELALDYLALGLDPKKVTYFRQSDLPEHAELCWILGCITPFSVLERGHAWKDAREKQTKDPTVGLFNYPVLMAADILLYKPDLVPVGQDQKQHVEIARDIGQKFNRRFGEVFKIPEPYIRKDVATVMGTDGRKMSKSYGNTIEIFAPEKELKKQIMGIVTDSTPVEDPKDPTSCTVFNIFKYFADKKEVEALEKKYKKGGCGYGDSKIKLYEKILTYFEEPRKKRIELSMNLDYVEEVLKKGAESARAVAADTLKQVKDKVGIPTT